MLSIQSRGGGCEKYYLSSTVEEYYLTESASSVWLGKGAHALDLSGPVQSEDFKGLLRGYSPAGSKLVQNAGADTERPAGWDLTFSMPKSAGVLWAVTDDATRTKIEAAHLSAVTAALGYLEREAAVSRTVTKVVVDNKPKRIVEHQKAELIVGAFHHGTSRLQDPQPHTHCLVMNVARRESDGRFGALYTPPVYKHKMAAGAVYQAQLANELRALGLPVEAVRNADGVPLGYFEVAGVPKEVRDHFSKRRQQIEESLRTKGHASAEAAEVAALDTRPGKRDLPPKEDLFRAWREEAAARGLTRDKAQALFGREPRYDKRDVERVKSALDAAKERLTESVSHFSERELYRETLIRTLGTGVSPEVVRQAVSTATQKSGDLVALGRHKGEQQFTTKAVWQTEKELLASTAKLDERVAKGLNPGAVEARVNEPRRGNDGSTFTLTEEQKGAVQCLTRDGGSVRVMSGGAGTGKTTVLADVRELYERAGYRVVGAAVAGVAARGLESGSGIKSDTVAMRFLEMDRRLRDTLKHHGKQLVRAALGLPTYSLDAKLTIDKKTVLVVDEAGMLGTKDLARLMKAVEAGGGRIILVGDARQLPPVQAGGGFRGVGERIGPAGRHELTEVTRQRDPRDREVGTHIARGNAREALRNLAARGKLHVGESRPEAVARLVSDWTAEGVAKPKDHVIIAVTNADVRDLNTRAQAERATAGELSGRAVQVNGYAVRVGDRVMLRERSKKLGVENGDLGTVTAVSGNKVAVVLDRGKDPVVLSTKRYRAVELGYAVTTYKSQGATFQNTYAYAGGWLTSRELGYVTATRYKEEGRFYTDKFEAGGDLTKLARGQQKDADLSRSPLARQLEQSREKVLAHDVPSEQNLKQERSQKAAAPPPPPPEPQRRR